MGLGYKELASPVVCMHACVLPTAPARGSGTKDRDVS